MQQHTDHSVADPHRADAGAPRPTVPPPRSEDSLRPNRLRGQVADRLAVAARRHIRHAAQQRWVGKPIGPHIVVFLYAEPGTADASAIRVASRMFLDGGDVADLATILRQLHDLAVGYLENGGFDPREQLANRVEEMTRGARYIGVGVSTLHPDGLPAAPVGLAAGVQRSPEIADADVPFRILAILEDGTQLLVRSAGGLRPLQIRSTHTLDLSTVPSRQWRLAGPHFLQTEPDVAGIADELLRLHALAATAYGSVLGLPERLRRGARWTQRP